MLGAVYAVARLVRVCSDRLKEEQEHVMKQYNGEVSLDALTDMTVLNACVKETLRMYPPLIILMRKVMKTQQYKGWTIPEVRYVVCTVCSVGCALADLWCASLTRSRCCLCGAARWRWRCAGRHRVRVADCGARVGVGVPLAAAVRP